jgi:hypothetical protein
MTQIRRTSRRLGSTTAVAAVMVAAAVLVSSSAEATVTFRSSSITLGVQDSMPSGAVGGVQSPAEVGSTLNLMIDASDTTTGLASAQASIGGNTASVSLCPPPASAGGAVKASFGGECPESVSNVPLSIDVGGEGSHVLLVTVTDAAGNTTTLVDQTIEVQSPPPPGSNTVTIGIGSGGGPPEGGPPGGGKGRNGGRGKVSGASSSNVCRSPLLSMRFASRPVRYVKFKAQRIPVLRAGRRYRYSGQLTCLPVGSTRRVSAPDGTVVHVLYEVGRRTLTAGRGTMVAHRGRLSALLGFKSARTIVFRYGLRGGENVDVRIRTAIAHRHSHRHHGGKRRGGAR